MNEAMRYVVGGQELGRAPALKKCPLCGGIADYTSAKGDGYRATCSACGAQSGPGAWPSNAGDAWNRRTSEQPRVITLGEILEFKADLQDNHGRTACWLETIEGDIAALVIEAGVSMDGTEVYECGWGDYWPREKVDAQGIRWRLWDKKPKTEDREREPWGRISYDCMSAVARAEAERIRRELDARRDAEEKRRRERERRRCIRCAHCTPVDTEGRDLGAATPFVCAVDGHIIESTSGPGCKDFAEPEEREGRL